MKPDISELHEFDEVVVSGQACSPIRSYTDLKCTIATVSPPNAEEPDWYIKVWPEKESPEDNGKIWFKYDDVTSLAVTWRSDNET